MTYRPILIAAFVAFATPALANECPAIMGEIDAALPAASLSAEERAEVDALRAEGERLHSAGDHDASVDRLNAAKAILGL